MTGSCFCGTVQFEIELPTLFCGHCHCSMCRRPHGASFVTWTAVPPERFRYTAGAETVSVYQSSKNGTRSFCRNCGSQMICQTEPEAIDVALAALHGKIDREPKSITTMTPGPSGPESTTIYRSWAVRVVWSHCSVQPIHDQSKNVGRQGVLGSWL